MITNPKFKWPQNISAAVSLTYDDGIPNHHQVVARDLNKFNLKGTFNVPAISDVIEHPELWEKIASEGHELGNHTAFHPCRSESPDQHPWLEKAYNLVDYTPRRWTEEMRVANFILNRIDGQTVRTFANTCCDTFIGKGDDKQPLEPLIEQLFLSARGVHNLKPVNPKSFNPQSLGHILGDGQSADYLIEQMEDAITKNYWLIIEFHGVGKGSHVIYIDEKEHFKFLDYLSKKENVWIDTMKKITEYLIAEAN